MAGFVTSAVRKQRKMNAGVRLFMQSGIPGPSAAHVQDGFSYPNQYRVVSSAHTQSCVS